MYVCVLIPLSSRVALQIPDRGKLTRRLGEEDVWKHLETILYISRYMYVCKCVLLEVEAARCCNTYLHTYSPYVHLHISTPLF